MPRPPRRSRHVSAGIFHTCGVATDGRAYCWGRNPFGGLGDGTFEDRLRPTAVAGGLTFRQVSVGDGFSCGVTTDGLAYCWGWGFDGILGNGSTQNSPVPVAVRGDRRYQRRHLRRESQLRREHLGRGLLLGQQRVRPAG